MWRNRTPFGKRVVNKYGSECYYYRSFFHGTLHMWARIDEEHNLKQRKKCLLFKHEKNNQTLSNDWPTYCHTGILSFVNVTISNVTPLTGWRWIKGITSLKFQNIQYIDPFQNKEYFCKITPQAFFLYTVIFQIRNYRFVIINCWNTEEINIQIFIMHVCPTSLLDVLGLEHSILSGTTYVKHIRNKAIRLTDYIYIHTLYKPSKNCKTAPQKQIIKRRQKD